MNLDPVKEISLLFIHTVQTLIPVLQTKGFHDVVKAKHHILHLCEKHDIRRTVVFNQSKCRANGHCKAIYTPPLTTRANISIAYHELGHLLHIQAVPSKKYGRNPDKRVLLYIISRDPFEIYYECAANLWATRNAVVKLCHKTLISGLWSHISPAIELNKQKEDINLGIIELISRQYSGEYADAKELLKHKYKIKDPRKIIIPKMLLNKTIQALINHKPRTQ